MSNPSNPPQPHDDLPDETPEVLTGIAERMQKAIEDLFAVKAEAAELSKNTKLPDEVERVLCAAARSNSTADQDPTSTASDRRLYLPWPEGWEIRIKSGPREYCYYRNPKEEWFHLLVDGELFLQFSEQKICLNCAYRQGILTDDRLFWQTGRRRPRIPPSEETMNALKMPPEPEGDALEQSTVAYGLPQDPNERQI